ncbi:hypothetical protein GOP47_0030731 [Adiantum capillus-veneris]|nr:hypothetical protein GOP47_0030731 [Adiantum capillus-veneris]
MQLLIGARSAPFVQVFGVSPSPIASTFTRSCSVRGPPPIAQGSSTASGPSIVAHTPHVAHVSTAAIGPPPTVRPPPVAPSIVLPAIARPSPTANVSSQSTTPLPSVGSQNKGKRPRQVDAKWTDVATAACIKNYEERWVHVRKGNLRSKDWDEVIAQLNKEVEMDYSCEQVKNKIDTLRKKYKKEMGKTTAMGGTPVVPEEDGEGDREAGRKVDLDDDGEVGGTIGERSDDTTVQDSNEVWGKALKHKK